MHSFPISYYTKSLFNYIIFLGVIWPKFIITIYEIFVFIASPMCVFYFIELALFDSVLVVFTFVCWRFADIAYFRYPYCIL